MTLNPAKTPIASLFVAITLIGLVQAVEPTPWRADFARQPIASRPPLEVRYTDGKREAFEILAARYHLLGELREPHRLLDAESGKPWLTLSAVDSGGEEYRTEFASKPSRINLYRRGPYYCEIHWFDITLADADGHTAPLKGDLALYCYPEKLLASLTLHATDTFDAASLGIQGVAPQTLALEPFRKGQSQQVTFSLFGESTPLPASALETVSAVSDLRYDARRGCYVVGSHNPGGFEQHFYRHPNHYEAVEFRVTNDDQPRVIYVCHESVSGAKGTVEGGVLLDEQEHPLPITVQISKNFAGEKEEKFYNPTDQPFSETWFPLVLAANETRPVKSLHLYQNWGRHMVKQFSSLGAWTDYFHSSTGVTETTCYVPFKFAGLPGVAIADMRAMSQATFWRGQPQHDNVAGHSFLSYHDGTKWQYLAYRGTTYHSTGPNWMDITLRYLSTDGKVRASVRTFELPQKDELRNFVRVRYEILQPLVIERARENLRLLSITSRIQSLRYKRFASPSVDEELTFSDDHLAVGGKSLSPLPSFAAVYGDQKGSNAYVLQRFSAPFAPAAGVWCKKNGDSRLFLAADADDVTLDAGDVIEFDAVLLPYGETDGAATPLEEAVYYGSQAPRVTDITRGQKISDFPTIVRADADRAEFTVRGGRDLIPIIIGGLSDYRGGRLYQQQETGWRLLSDARVGSHDGLQTFCEPAGTFGAVFLVHSNEQPQRLKFELGSGDSEPMSKINVRVEAADDQMVGAGLLVQTKWMDSPIRLAFPTDLRAGEPVAPIPAWRWARTEGDSLWFESNLSTCSVGGRVTPNDDNIDLEFWVRNRAGATMPIEADFIPDLKGTAFDDPSGERTWILTDEWKRLSTPQETRSDAVLTAVTSPDGRHVFAVAWPQGFPSCPPGRQSHVRGKLYLLEGTLADLESRVRRELLLSSPVEERP